MNARRTETNGACTPHRGGGHLFARLPRAAVPLLMALATLLGAAAEANASVRRFAFVVGSDRGDASEAPLRFAEEDATRMHDLLLRYGGVERSDATLLVGESADTVRMSLIDLNGRLRRLASDPTSDTLLFVFYSGHADAEALHLGGTRLSLRELKQLVSGSPARMRVLVLDACQSGALTGVKGSRPAPQFDLDVDERLHGEGVAFITSSTAGELSQESGDLNGSFFAHYFMVALQGVGDTSADGKVTLREAFDYASQLTLRATSKTAVGPQHPTYEYDIRGRTDVTITDLTTDAAQRATLVFEHPGEFLVFRAAADGPLVAEVLTSRPNRRLIVPPGRYLVRLRTPAELRDKEIFADAGETVSIGADDMQPVAYQRLLAKGGFTRGRRHGPSATLHYRGETLDDLGGMLLGGVSYPVLFGRVWLQPRILVGGSSITAADVTLRQVELDAELLVSYGVDVRWLVLLFGGGVGGTYLRQEASVDELGSRSSMGALFSGHVAAVLPVQSGFYVRIGAEAVAMVLRREGADGVSWNVDPTYRFGVGLGYSL